VRFREAVVLGIAIVKSGVNTWRAPYQSQEQDVRDEDHECGRNIHAIATFSRFRQIM